MKPIGDRETLARRRPNWWRALLYVETTYNQLGITPPIREVGQAAGMASTSTLYALNNLVAMGFLKKIERGADSTHCYYLPVGPSPGELTAQVRTLTAQLERLRARTADAIAEERRRTIKTLANL